MQVTKTQESDGTIELTITIPWATVAAAYEKTVEEIVKNAELEGFRKGKAPRKLVEGKLDKSKTYEEMLKTLIPQVYGEAAKQEKIKPIVIPKVELKEATEDKDWIVRALTSERPKIELGEYRKAIQDAKAAKSQKIWTPGQDQKPEDEEKAKKITLDELLLKLYESVKPTISALLIEHEVNRLLSELIDQTKKLGLTVEQYLASTRRTGETLKKEFEDQAKKTVTLEFALEEIADQEGILISDDDIDAVIKTAKTEEEKKSLENQRYYMASVLRRQKTLDFLSNL